MQQAIAFLVTAVAFLAGIAQIVQLSRDKDQGKAVQRGIVIVVFVAIVIGAVNFVYFGPKQAGDEFLDGLRAMNSGLMLSKVCDDSILYTELGGFGGMIVTLGGAFGTTGAINNQSFNPFTGELRFNLIMNNAMASPNSQNIFPVTLHIRSEGLTDFCVYQADGLISQ